MPKQYEYELAIQIEDNKKILLTLNEVGQIKTELEKYNPCLNISLNVLRNILSTKRKPKTENFSFRNIELKRKDLGALEYTTILST